MPRVTWPSRRCPLLSRKNLPLRTLRIQIHPHFPAAAEHSGAGPSGSCTGPALRIWFLLCNSGLLLRAVLQWPLCVVDRDAVTLHESQPLSRSILLLPPPFPLPQAALPITLSHTLLTLPQCLLPRGPRWRTSFGTRVSPWGCHYLFNLAVSPKHSLEGLRTRARAGSVKPSGCSWQALHLVEHVCGPDTQGQGPGRVRTLPKVTSCWEIEPRSEPWVSEPYLSPFHECACPAPNSQPRAAALRGIWEDKARFLGSRMCHQAAEAARSF